MWYIYTQWHPTPVLLPGKFHGWRSLEGCSPWGSLRVGHDWATSLSLFTFMQWRRKWQPTPVPSIMLFWTYINSSGHTIHRGTIWQGDVFSIPWSFRENYESFREIIQLLCPLGNQFKTFLIFVLPQPTVFSQCLIKCVEDSVFAWFIMLINSSILLSHIFL